MLFLLLGLMIPQVSAKKDISVIKVDAIGYTTFNGHNVLTKCEIVTRLEPTNDELIFEGKSRIRFTFNLPKGGKTLTYSASSQAEVDEVAKSTINDIAHKFMSMSEVPYGGDTRWMLKGTVTTKKGIDVVVNLLVTDIETKGILSLNSPFE